MPYNSVAYVREAGGPGELQKHVTDIQGSGLTTVNLAMLHIGDPKMLHPADPYKDTSTMELGDFIYNDYPANLVVRGASSIRTARKRSTTGPHRSQSSSNKEA
jgi:hypothetical protein